MMHKTHRRQPTQSTPDASAGGVTRSPTALSTLDLTSKSLIMLRKSSSYSSVKAELMKLDMQANSSASSSSSAAVTQAHRLSTGDISVMMNVDAHDDRLLRRHIARRSGSVELPDANYGSAACIIGDRNIDRHFAAAAGGAAPPRSSFSGTPSTSSAFNSALQNNSYRAVHVNGKLWETPASPATIQQQADTTNNAMKNSKAPPQKTAPETSQTNQIGGRLMAPSSSPSSSSKWDDAEKWILSPSHAGIAAARPHQYCSSISPYASQGASCNTSPLNIAATSAAAAAALLPPLSAIAAGVFAAAKEAPPPPSTTTSTLANSPYHIYSARSLGSAATEDGTNGVVAKLANDAHDLRYYINVSGGIAAVKGRQQQSYGGTDAETLPEAHRERQDAAHAAAEVYVADVEEDADIHRPWMPITSTSTAPAPADAIADWTQIPYPPDLLLPESRTAMMNGIPHNYNQANTCAAGHSNGHGRAAASAGRIRMPPISCSKKVLITRTNSACAPMRDASTDASPQRLDRSRIIMSESKHNAQDYFPAERCGVIDANNYKNQASLRDVGTQITPSPSSAASRSSTPLKSPAEGRYIYVGHRDNRTSNPASAERLDSGDFGGAANLGAPTGSAGRPNTPAQVRRSLEQAPPPSLNMEIEGSRIMVSTAAQGCGGGITGGGSSAADVERRSPFDLQASSDSTPASSASSGSNNWERLEVSEGLKQQMSKWEREEARIDAWEMHQKAKAEAELQKLEMKLGRMRERAREKIMRRVAAAKARAEGMRAAARATNSKRGGGNQEAAGGSGNQQQEAATTGIVRKGCFPILQAS